MTDVDVELQHERRYLARAHARVGAARARAVLVAEHAGANAAAGELEPDALFARDVAGEPDAAIAAGSPLGPTRLYVALTRTTRLLWVVEPGAPATQIDQR